MEKVFNSSNKEHDMDLMTRLASTLNADKAQRGYRQDMRLIGTQVDMDEGVLWMELAFSPEAGKPELNDVMNIVYTAAPEYDIDWGRSKGFSNKGIISLALVPSVERIPVASYTDIPTGFQAMGSGVYVLKATTGDSYWKLVKNNDGLVLIRTDGSKPNPVVPLVDATDENVLKNGDLVKAYNHVGIYKGKGNDGKSKMRLLGQTKEVEVDDVALAGFDPSKDKQVLKDYYMNIYPADFVEQLLADEPKIDEVKSTPTEEIK